MLALLIIAVIIALLTLTVYVLHKYQTMEVEFSADRIIPLPPLDKDLESLGKIRPHRPDVKAPLRRPSATATGQSTNVDAPDWQTRVAELRKAGDRAGALAVCESAYPAWGAFNQACILIRSQLRPSQNSAKSMDDDLMRLYRTAALAELLHDKSPEFVQLTTRQRQRIDLTVARKLDMPYLDLGYAYLRLIRKQDVKLMHLLWGRPGKHQTPRQLHRDWWHNTLAELC
ncbi:MAG: hypothetical protein IIB77_14890 [Proteobacteria bacterium]|nr:hypothetical protein [Pseudomonadota bacterium]